MAEGWSRWVVEVADSYAVAESRECVRVGYRVRLSHQRIRTTGRATSKKKTDASFAGFRALRAVAKGRVSRGNNRVTACPCDATLFECELSVPRL